MCLTLKKTEKLEEPCRRGTCSQAASKVEINVFKSQKISLDRTIKEHQFICVPFLYIHNTLAAVTPGWVQTVSVPRMTPSIDVAKG